MIYKLLIVLAAVICWSIIKISSSIRKNEKNIDPEEEINLYGVSKGDFSNIKRYSYEEVPMFRDLPCKDDYYMAFYISSNYGINKNNSYIINVILLKWIKAGNVLVIDNGIKLVKEPNDKIESELFRMMKKTSKDDFLDANEFKWYCKENYEKFNNWLANTLIMKNSEIYNNRELIDIEWVKDNHIDGHYEFIATDKLNDLALQLAGLKKFFHRMTSMREKLPIEVKLWKEYLIYAEIFGVAYTVADAFSELYDIDTSNFVDISFIDKFIDFTIVTTFKEIEASKAFENSTTPKMDSSHSNDWSRIDHAMDYDFGGGGFSSDGGGGGSFGGGGGGGGSR